MTGFPAAIAVFARRSGPRRDSYVSFIVGPRCCYVPPALEDGGRVWGAAVQIYSLRSERDWGMGDFTALRTLIEQWGRRGAGVIGVNPLHALFPHNPAHPAPTARLRVCS